MNDPRNIDYEARRKSDLALEKIAAHEKYCEERGRKAETFESEMRSDFKEMHKCFREGLNLIHERLNLLIRTALFALLTVLMGGAGTVIWWLVQNQAGKG